MLFIVAFIYIIVTIWYCVSEYKKAKRGHELMQKAKELRKKGYDI